MFCLREKKIDKTAMIKLKPKITQISVKTLFRERLEMKDNSVKTKGSERWIRKTEEEHESCDMNFAKINVADY